MATSSSAKKVARVAAKSGSGTQTAGKSTKGRNWLFGLAIVAIIALGVAIVAFARSENEGLGKNDTPPKANLQNGEAFDHWHAAFAVSVCGNEQANLQDGITDAQGIHTHGDGLIHIHPFTRLAAGERATLGKYFDQVGFTVTDSGFQVPDGMTMEDGATTVEEGVTTCGGKEGELVMAHWKDARTAGTAEPDEIFTEGFGDVNFSEDLGAYTLAFVAKGDRDIKPPSSAAEIESLGQADAGAAAPDDGTTETLPPESTEDTTVTTAADGG